MKDFIYKNIKEAKIIAIIRGLSYEESMKVIDSLIVSGINVLEVTLNTEEAIKIIKDAREKYMDKAFIGAGTVKNVDDAEKAIKAGAQFLISPNLCEDTVKVCNEQEVLIIPGVFSPTEIVKACELGCNMVKLFPAISLGTEFIRQIKAPLNNINIMAVGGVNLNNIKEFFENGADAVGIGSALIRNDLIKEGKYELLKKHFIYCKTLVQSL